MMTTPVRALTPGAFLDAPAGGLIEADRGLWGSDGLHGGLSLALMAGAMSAHLPGRALESATIRFHRPITEAFRLETELDGFGRTLPTATARAFTGLGPCADATAVFASAHTGGHRVVTRPAPAVPGPERCERLVVPPETMPVASHLDIRPAGPALPRSGGTAPVRTAWIRLTEDDTPPDFRRLVFLLDVPAPSRPTVQLTAHPGLGLSRASSPWVLVRAATRPAAGDGWTDERVDAWGPDGLHLGSARRLRVVRGA
ncbi:thioesterase family protein [Actinocorallia populi]|uniref:thioesterase family protein n=1 Tax=Actinocorallia populi TaxID=2079200 RepID=UPI0018E567A0|nr:thioesterase family protein [Actinocorallia populi]